MGKILTTKRYLKRKNVRKRYTLRLLVSSNYFYIPEKPKDLLYDIHLTKADKEHPRPPTPCQQVTNSVTPHQLSNLFYKTGMTT